jgi:hypothetical protein
MDKIDALRSIDGQAAVFLRFGIAGHLIIGIQGTEREIERAAWFDLPLWIPTPPPEPIWIDD